MARNMKSGLGRGLNSLLGESYETTTQKESNVERKRVVVEPGEIPAYDPILEPRRPPVSRETSSPAVTKATAPISDTASEKIEIKEVKARDVNVDEIPLSEISPNPNQPRTNFNQEELQELAASIERDGLLQPLLVRKISDHHYQIVAGERRWQACKILKMTKVPVRFKNVDEDKALELALIENLQRTDLNPIEEAYGYRRLMERNKMTQSDVAQAMSKGRSTIANALRLLELPEDAQELLYEEKITAGHARAILSVPTKEGREKLTQKLKEEKLSVRETEAIARLLSGKANATPATKRAPLPETYKKVARALKDMLHTNVKVKSSKGKNKIEIEFKDEEELTRLFEELTSVNSES